MKLVSLFLVGYFLVLSPRVAHAFEITLPEHYHEDLESKRSREGEVLWRELDRIVLEESIQAFVAAHPSIDRINLAAIEDRRWQKVGRAQAFGPWRVFLSEWELCFPPLRQIQWDKAKLVVSLAYDFKTKVLKVDGDGEIRLYFAIERRGSFFARKTITAHLESFDYGEVFLELPFGGVKLRKSD